MLLEELTVCWHLECDVQSWAAVSKRVWWKQKGAETGSSKDAQETSMLPEGSLPCFSEWDASAWKRDNKGKIYKITSSRQKKHWDQLLALSLYTGFQGYQAKQLESDSKN